MTDAIGIVRLRLAAIELAPAFGAHGFGRRFLDARKRRCRAGLAIDAWFVNFGDGAVTDFVVNVGNVVDNEYYVRCVR